MSKVLDMKPSRGMKRSELESPHRTITVDGHTLTLVIERKPVKNVNARLRHDTLSVSAPLKLPQNRLDEMVIDLARKLLRRAHAHQVNQQEDALGLARRIAERFRPTLPAPPDVREVIFVTTQRMRWGSYSQATGTIRLNAVLRRMPSWVLESVVTHELAHVVHPNHSAAFWKLARHVCPETDRARAFLNGVSWLGQHLEALPPVERAILTHGGGCEDEHDETA